MSTSAEGPSQEPITTSAESPSQEPITTSAEGPSQEPITTSTEGPSEEPITTSAEEPPPHITAKSSVPIPSSIPLGNLEPSQILEALDNIFVESDHEYNNEDDLEDIEEVNAGGLHFDYDSDKHDDEDDPLSTDDDVPVPDADREAELERQRWRKILVKKRLVHDIESACDGKNYDPYVPPTKKVECSAVLEKGAQGAKINWVNQPPASKRGRRPANMKPLLTSGKVVGVARDCDHEVDCWELFFRKVSLKLSCLKLIEILQSIMKEGSQKERRKLRVLKFLSSGLFWASFMLRVFSIGTTRITREYWM